jgi:hypothetical protein
MNNQELNALWRAISLILSGLFLIGAFGSQIN